MAQRWFEVDRSEGGSVTYHGMNAVLDEMGIKATEARRFYRRLWVSMSGAAAEVTNKHFSAKTAQSTARVAGGHG